MNQKNILLLFSNCILVKGVNRATICDLQKDQVYFIPLGLYEILTKHKGKKLELIKEIYNFQFDDIIDKYVDFLITNELAFFCSNPKNFPSLKKEWKFPGELSNAIIERDTNSNYDFKLAISQLEDLGCRYIELRYYNIISVEELISTINSISESQIKNIDIFIKYDLNVNIQELTTKLLIYSRIGRIIIHSINKQEIPEFNNSKVCFLEEIINNNSHCGKISSNYFQSNTDLYMESQYYNNCLNKKISIDIDGNIRNCPSLKDSYGNLNDIAIEDAIDKPGFKKYWNITKDQISVCKDCEFRYVCTDCRAYIESPEDVYSKPLKCGYDPYNNKWEDWTVNPLKLKAIEYYGMVELIKK
jgi:SPASM domain peptide maturase of grasp-with-spasm system